MRIRQYLSGYIYVLSTDFGAGNVVSINRSQNNPEELITALNGNRESRLLTGGPVELLYFKKFENCNVAESLVHQFLIQNDYCAVTPKDYQISLDDAVKLIEMAAEIECLSHDLVLDIKHRNCLPSDATNYFMLGNIFNGRFHEERGEHCDSFQIDELASFSCFQKGYEFGDDRCVFELATCYESGQGVDENPKKSLELFEELYQMDKFAGIGGAFRVCLQSRNHYKASALLLDFFNWCDEDQSCSDKDEMKDSIETHEGYTRSLANFVWDTFYLEQDFEILEPFFEHFKEFKNGICLQLERDREVLEQQGFMELSSKILTCRDSFMKFLESKSDFAA